MEPQYNEVPLVWQNVFAITRICSTKVFSIYSTITGVKKKFIVCYTKDIIKVHDIEVSLYIQTGSKAEGYKTTNILKPLSLNISMQILKTDLHTYLIKLVERIC